MPKRSYIRLNPPASYVTWGETDVTVGIGGTVDVAYTTTGTAPSNTVIDTYLNGIAASSVGGSVVSFTGISAGTVTISASSGLGGGTQSVNALTITVTAAVDDQNFLNERGLAHFWDNIDSAKQDKLTAGSNITINNGTISATQPTVNNATLTIQQNGTSLGTFTANASSNATIDVLAPKLTTLTGSVQLGDYHRTVIALCEVASTSSTSLNSWTSGKIVAHRNNGAYGLAVIDINIECKRSTLYYSNVSYLSNLALLSATPNLDSDLGFRPCTFKYNNVYYGGIEFYISSSSAPTVVFTGVGNFDVFGLDYYSAAHGSTASTVLNSEVYNSINFTQWNKERGTWYN